MSDLISRTDAIEAIFKVGHEHVEEKVIPLGAVTDYSDAIKALPSAEGGDADMTVIPEGTGLMKSCPDNGALPSAEASEPLDIFARMYKAESEPTEAKGDLISRAEAIEAVEAIRDLLSVEAHCAITERISALSSAEAVEAVRDTEWVALRRDEYEDFLASAEAVQGEWILVKGSNGKDYHKCSKCLHTQEITGVKNFCAVCGTRMKGGEDE